MSFWDDNVVRWIETACLMEVMTPKPGNVYPGRPFDDCSVDDFVRVARAIAPVLADTPRLGVGQSVLTAVETSRQTAKANTSLGIILLIAPLAAVPPDISLAEGVAAVLSALTADDASQVYEAIRMARPGGLQMVSEQDVARPPTIPLVDCMRLAADRDQVARQYVSDFEDVLTIARVELRESRLVTVDQRDQIALTALRQLACAGDTLIARKCGTEVSEMVSDKAASVVAAGWPLTRESQLMWAGLDDFLRADGNRRNPGATADLTAAALFAALREGYLLPDGDWWQAGDNE